MATTEEKPEETPAVEPATADTNGTTGPDEPATNGDAPVEKKKGSSKKKGKKGKKGAKEDGAEKMEGAGGDDVEIVAEVKKKPKKNNYKHQPPWPKMTFKTALRNAVKKGRVKQV